MTPSSEAVPLPGLRIPSFPSSKIASVMSQETEAVAIEAEPVVQSVEAVAIEAEPVVQSVQATSVEAVAASPVVQQAIVDDDEEEDEMEFDMEWD